MATAVWIWFGSFAAGLISVVCSLRDAANLRIRLGSIVYQRDPTASMDLQRRTVNAALVSLVAATVLMILLQLALLLIARRALYWARIMLTIATILAIFIAGYVQDVVAGPHSLLVDLDRFALLVEILLSIAALVAIHLPSASAWFKDPYRTYQT